MINDLTLILTESLELTINIDYYTEDDVLSCTDTFTSDSSETFSIETSDGYYLDVQGDNASYIILTFSSSTKVLVYDGCLYYDSLTVSSNDFNPDEDTEIIVATVSGYILKIDNQIEIDNLYTINSTYNSFENISDYYFLGEEAYLNITFDKQVEYSYEDEIFIGKSLTLNSVISDITITLIALCPTKKWGGCKVNWTSDDYFNYYDWNRIWSNLYYIYDLGLSIGFFEDLTNITVYLQTYDCSIITDWTVKTVNDYITPFEAIMLETVVWYLNTYSYNLGYEANYDYEENLNTWTYNDINRIEDMILSLYNYMISERLLSFRIGTNVTMLGNGGV